MENFNEDFSIQRKAILSELYHIHITAKNLGQDLRTLVALTDPEDGILVKTPDGFKLPQHFQNITG